MGWEIAAWTLIGVFAVLACAAVVVLIEIARDYRN